MANTDISEKAEVFEYGLLTSRTSGILSEIIKAPHSALNPRDRSTIEHARNFTDKILQEGSFVFGECKEGILPNLDRLTTFNRALSTLEALNKLPNSRDEVRSYFEEIKDILNKILRSNISSGDVALLNSAKSFFSTIADMLLEELSIQKEHDLVFR